MRGREREKGRKGEGGRKERSRKRGRGRGRRKMINHTHPSEVGSTRLQPLVGLLTQQPQLAESNGHVTETLGQHKHAGRRCKSYTCSVVHLHA